MTDRLSRFTPHAPGFDRDAILFAAGRRAARGSWLWKAAAGLLALSQVMTLVALWPKPSAVAPVAPPGAPGPVAEPPPAPASPPSDIWAAGSPPDVLQRADDPRAAVQFVPSDPPLTARSRFRLE